MSITLDELILPQDRILLGCTLRNFAVDFGNGGNAYTATIIEEPGQEFQLKNDVIVEGIISLVSITFNDTTLLGMVENWEEIVTDINGTGIFNVKITMGGNFPLPLINFLGDPTIDSTQINGTFIRVPIDTVEASSSGIRITNIFNIMESNTFDIQGTSVNFDFSDVKSKLNGLDTYFVQDLNYSLQELMIRLIADYGSLTYFLNASSSDDIITISIKLVEDVEGVITESPFDFITTQEAGKITSISRGSSFKAEGGTVANVRDLISYIGGFKNELIFITSGLIDQFWGFDSNGSPFTVPSVVLTENHPDQIYHPSIEDLKSLINQGLADGANGFDSDKIIGINSLAREFWGRKFIVNSGALPILDTNNDIVYEPTEFGWWEGGGPSGNFFLDDSSIARDLLKSEDGRWQSFIKLSLPSGVWDTSVTFSKNVVFHDNEYYMIVDLERINNYIIITLPVSLTFLEAGHEHNVLNKMSSIAGSYLALENQIGRYGAYRIFNHQAISKEDEADPFFLSALFNPVIKKVSFIDDDLVPWSFSNGGSNNDDATNNLLEFLKKQDGVRLPPKESFSEDFGSIEVADVPLAEVLLREIIVTSLNISFGIDGIKTRYKIVPTVSSATINSSNINDKLRALGAEVDSLVQKVNKIKIPRFKTPPNQKPHKVIERIINSKIKPIKDEIAKIQKADQELKLTQPDMEFIYNKPEGGLGVIESIDTGGPFYNVRRLNYADIDPETFAGGLNITTSYFLTEWKHVRNLAEDDNSPGYLLVGTRVTVSIFSDSEFGPFIPYMEQSPQTFSPPVGT